MAVVLKAAGNKTGRRDWFLTFIQRDLCSVPTHYQGTCYFPAVCKVKVTVLESQKKKKKSLLLTFNLRRKTDRNPDYYDSI